MKILSLYQLKPKFQALLYPLVVKLFDAKITPNQITVLTCLSSLLVSLIIILMVDYTAILIIYPFWMLIRMALNAIDGMLAKNFNQESLLGAYLNELGDIVSDAALIAVFGFVDGISNYLIFIVIILSILSEYAGVIAPMLGGSRRYDGPMGKSDRALIFSLIALGISLNLIPLIWINYALVIITFFLIITIVNRIKKGIYEARK